MMKWDSLRAGTLQKARQYITLCSAKPDERGIYIYRMMMFIINYYTYIHVNVVVDTVHDVCARVCVCARATRAPVCVCVCV